MQSLYRKHQSKTTLPLYIFKIIAAVFVHSSNWFKYDYRAFVVLLGLIRSFCHNELKMDRPLYVVHNCKSNCLLTEANLSSE